MLFVINIVIIRLLKQPNRVDGGDGGGRWVRGGGRWVMR